MIDTKIKCIADMEMYAIWSVSIYSKEIVSDFELTEKLICKSEGYCGRFIETVPAEFEEYFQGEYYITFIYNKFKHRYWFNETNGIIDDCDNFIYVLNATLNGESQVL